MSQRRGKRVSNWEISVKTLSVLGVGVLAFTLLASAVDVVRVEGDSMDPVLRDTQVVMVNRLAYGLQPPLVDAYLFRWKAPRRGDIVFFHNPVDGSLSVKRCLAVSGDPVTLTADGARIAGRDVALSPFARNQLADRDSLPEGRLFVLGDNRLDSRDSRHYGLVRLRDVFGTLARVRVTG